MPAAELNEQSISESSLPRRLMLEQLKPHLSRKRYFALEEKLAAEEKQLRDILDWRLGRQNRLSRFTFILDQHYFEQEFLPTPPANRQADKKPTLNDML
ncbi:MAG TPA: hypothetical protein VHA30_03375 [Patescibacteria group bacterium]|nr:hypothetical protein [Patescibacteria group bacterium]